MVLAGYDMSRRVVKVADPYEPHPMGPHLHYEVRMAHLINAIMLGILTYDANLLVIQPRK